MVWTTKNRMPFLTKTVRATVFKHIQENAREKKIFINRIGGGQEHIHLLISLGVNQTISDIIRLLKGESSFWINKEKLVQGRFEWQDDYYCVSVGEDEIAQVQEYIQNQDEHHRGKSFAEEYQKFITKEMKS